MNISGALPVLDKRNQRLLQSIVEVARAIFNAEASSIFIFDSGSGELVFEAVSGAGEDTLVGQRFPVDEGIAGWVLQSGVPLIVDNVTSNPLHARKFAESTGYTPTSVMAAPLMDEGTSIGVLEVMDRRPDPTRALGDLELLGLFASQATVALQVVIQSQEAMARVIHDDTLAGVAVALGGLTGTRREAGRQLLSSIRDVLATEA
ncbi:GAF domain-containing protein [Nonomuraea sp. NPDC049784]|uniref:GAF domain-containing protein n=1 Tax=Nonomuraea sp. NPDC049784 TaxID=3154361 RepID=UPI0033E53636